MMTIHANHMGCSQGVLQSFLKMDGVVGLAEMKKPCLLGTVKALGQEKDFVELASVCNLVWHSARCPIRPVPFPIRDG